MTFFASAGVTVSISDYGCCETDLCNTANIMTPYSSSGSNNNNNNNNGGSTNSTNTANKEAANKIFFYSTLFCAFNIFLAYSSFRLM